MTSRRFAAILGIFSAFLILSPVLSELLEFFTHCNSIPGDVVLWD